MDDDLIRRSDVIKAIDDNVNGSGNRLYLKDLIKTIPTIKPSEYADIAYGIGVCQGKASIEPKRGEWIETNEVYHGVALYRCSSCDVGISNAPTEMGKPIFPFCPWCGAKMK